MKEEKMMKTLGMEELDKVSGGADRSFTPDYVEYKDEYPRLKLNDPVIATTMSALIEKPLQ